MIKGRSGENWLAKKYGLTSVEATKLAAHPRQREIIDAVETWREENGFPAAASSLTRGVLLDLISQGRKTMAEWTPKDMTPKQVIKAAGQLGLSSSGRGEVWSLYAGNRFYKLSSPEDLYEVLTWASEVTADHRDPRAEAFQELAEIVEF